LHVSLKYDICTRPFLSSFSITWSSRLICNPFYKRVSVCRAVGSMGQRKSGALGSLGAAAPISTEEEQLKFQDSRFLATLVLGRSRWVTERDWLSLVRDGNRGTWSVPCDPLWDHRIRLHTSCCKINCKSHLIDCDRKLSSKLPT